MFLHDIPNPHVFHPPNLNLKKRQIIFEETTLRRMYFARFAILEMPIIPPPLGLAGPNYWHKQSRLGHWTMEMIRSEYLAISIMQNPFCIFLKFLFGPTYPLPRSEPSRPS